MTIKLAIVALAVALAVAPMETGAFTGGGGSPPKDSPGASDFKSGKKSVDAGDYQTAIKYLTKAVEADPKNADGFNQLGYSYRKLGDVETAFKHYTMALTITPKHLGANEYIGELYLRVGNLAKAEEHLKILDAACFFGCPEYTELKAAVKAYRAEHSS